MTSSSPPRAEEETDPSRDREALIAQLYRQHHHGLSRYLAGRFGQSGLDPEDVIQSAYVKLANHPDLSVIADRRAYLFTLACNIAIDNQRRHARQRVVHDELHAATPDLGISSEKILIDRERLQHIEAALRKMPKLRRRIFLLIRIEGLSVQEVAAQFAMTEAAVFKHVARALADCAKMLEKSDRRAGL